MIKLFWILLFMTAAAKAQVIQNDDLIHVGGSYVISSTVASLVYNKTKDKKKALVYGLAVSLVIGTGKELYDNRLHSKDTYTDLLSNTIGATLGVVTIRIAI